MARHQLTHRADCEASGVTPQFAAAYKGDLEPIFLCEHHTGRHTPALLANGWTIVVLNAKVPA